MTGSQDNQIGYSGENTPQLDLTPLVSGWIGAVEDDPARTRIVIYELARLKIQRAGLLLNRPMSQTDARRISSALEGAIERVEIQALKRDERRDARSYNQVFNKHRIPDALLATLRIVKPVIQIYDGAPATFHPFPHLQKPKEARPAAEWFSIVALASIAMAAFIFPLSEIVESMSISKANLPSSPAAAARSTVSTAKRNKRGRSLQSTSAPLPSTYGVYALNNGQLRELEGLPGMVPDARVFMSAAISKPSNTVLLDGHVDFIVYRRDVATSAPDKIAVRAVAKIPRAITFAAAGKPGTALVDDTWTIRNISYGFNVAPLSENPELILMQPEKPDFIFPAGRYALVVKGVAYDFTVAGSITDPAQCLERVAAANGTFYTECRKPYSVGPGRPSL